MDIVKIEGLELMFDSDSNELPKLDEARIILKEINKLVSKKMPVTQPSFSINDENLKVTIINCKKDD